MAPVQVIEYDLLVLRAGVVNESSVFTTLLSLVLQEVTCTDSHLMTDVSPGNIDEGVAVTVTVGKRSVFPPPPLLT